LRKTGTVPRAERSGGLSPLSAKRLSRVPQYSPRQLRVLEAFRSSYATKEDYRLQYAKRPMDFFTEVGHKFPPVIKKLFGDVYSGREHNVVVRAPRGGGKTFDVADIAWAKFYFQGWNVLDIAGALDQAQILNEYVAEFLERQDVAQYAEGETRVLVTGKDGNWIRACATSQTGIRGKHARGKPILLIFDEAALIQPEFIRAGLNTLTDASESIVMYLSTHHESTGRFAEMCDDPRKFGATLVTYDSFDVASKCADDCDHCFDAWSDRLKPGVAKEYTAEFRDHYCQGRAKKGEGHLRPDQIRAARVRNVFREWFEVENMGWRPAGEGSVIAPDAVKAAYKYDSLEFNPDSDHFISIDWGQKSMTAINVWQWDGDFLDHLASCEFSGVTLRLIEEKLEALASEFCTRSVYADSASPFENQQLGEDGFDVEPVKFGEYKETGAGWLKYLYEGGKVRGLREFELFISQLLKWKRDKNGKIVKKDDHHPDSALAGTKHINDGFGGRITVGSIPMGDSVEQSWDSILNQGERDFDRLAGAVD